MADTPLTEADLCPSDLLRGQEEAFARDVERLKARRGAFVRVACPACGAADAAPAFEKFTFSYVRCRPCGTIYMSPRPSPAVMASYYDASENYRYWAERIFPASEAARREKVQRPRLERVLALCGRHGVPTGTLVEVGAGFGTFAALARDAGAFRRVVAVERTPEMAAACRARGVETVERTIEEAADSVGDADVVAAFEVLEHLFDPRAFVDACARLLRPGGLLLLTCPNGEGFDIALLGAGSLAVDPEHVNFLNPRSVRLLAEARGFEVLEVSTPGLLDAEFVRTEILAGRHDVPRDPFLRRVLVDEWERLGVPFQRFLAENGLSSHMWLAAGRRL